MKEEEAEDKSTDEEEVEDKSTKEEVIVKEEEEVIVKEEEELCNIKEDGSDLSCPKGKVCDLENKKCAKFEDTMEVHNINGADVIGDELIVKKLKELIKMKANKTSCN